MTLPFERFRAVTETERFLLNLSDPKVTPGVPKAIRERARALLRHYPTASDLKLVEQAWDEPLVKMVSESPFKESW